MVALWLCGKMKNGERRVTAADVREDDARVEEGEGGRVARTLLTMFASWVWVGCKVGWVGCEREGLAACGWQEESGLDSVKKRTEKKEERKKEDGTC